MRTPTLRSCWQRTAEVVRQRLHSGIPANFVIAVIIVILVGLLCRKTAMGMMIEAVGINQEASRMTGIKPKKILFLVYAISASSRPSLVCSPPHP